MARYESNDSSVAFGREKVAANYFLLVAYERVELDKTVEEQVARVTQETIDLEDATGIDPVIATKSAIARIDDLTWGEFEHEAS